MPTGTEPYTTYDRGWIIRVRPPLTQSPAVEGPTRVMLLLHGWTGDENVMWIFTRNFPPNTWIIAPRGPVQSSEGGYGWLPRTEHLPALSDFAEIAPALWEAYQGWTADLHAPQQPFDVMGFSQGAAMAFALSAFYPQPVNRILALAGFLPKELPMPGRYSVLNGKKIYVAHGTKDETVPVELAQSAVRQLQDLGAQVTYCESEVGHKLSADCLRGLNAFIA